jgi:hypothetical protein
MYCHIGSQYERVPTQVRAGRPVSEGRVGGADPTEQRCDLAKAFDSTRIPGDQPMYG